MSGAYGDDLMKDWSINDKTRQANVIDKLVCEDMIELIGGF